MPTPSRQQGELPRWAEVVAAICLTPIVALCAIGSVDMFVHPPANDQVVLMMLIGTAMLMIAAWSAAMVVRLFTGRPSRSGGLLSPIALRVAAVMFGLLPFAGFFTGVYLKGGVQLLPLLQALLYFIIAGRLWHMARVRTASNTPPNVNA